MWDHEAPFIGLRNRSTSRYLRVVVLDLLATVRLAMVLKPAGKRGARPRCEWTLEQTDPQTLRLFRQLVPAQPPLCIRSLPSYSPTHQPLPPHRRLNAGKLALADAFSLRAEGMPLDAGQAAMLHNPPRPCDGSRDDKGPWTHAPGSR